MKTINVFIVMVFLFMIVAILAAAYIQTPTEFTLSLNMNMDNNSLEAFKIMDEIDNRSLPSNYTSVSHIVPEEDNVRRDCFNYTEEYKQEHNLTVEQLCIVSLKRIH